MSRSKLDISDNRYSYNDQKRSKTPTEVDSLEGTNDVIKRRPLTHEPLDYNHFD